MVPGCCAVITLVVALIVATEAVPTLKLRVPMDEPQLGTGVKVVLTAAVPEQLAVPLVSSAEVGGAEAPVPPLLMATLPMVFEGPNVIVACPPTEPLLKPDR